MNDPKVHMRVREGGVLKIVVRIAYMYNTTLLRTSGQPTLRPHNTHHILINNHMAQPHPLRHMPRTRPPHQRILEALL